MHWLAAWLPLAPRCRVRGALAVHPSFEAGLQSMRGFFETIQANPPGPPRPPVSNHALAAAVAAAVAAAGPLPAAAGAACGAVEAAAGRGAEGALGSMWVPSAPRGSIQGMFEMYQAKPLAQARVAGEGPAPPPVGQQPGLGQWSSQAAALRPGLGSILKAEPADDQRLQRQPSLALLKQQRQQQQPFALPEQQQRGQWAAQQRWPPQPPQPALPQQLPAVKQEQHQRQQQQAWQPLPLQPRQLGAAPPQQPHRQQPHPAVKQEPSSQRPQQPQLLHQPSGIPPSGNSFAAPPGGPSELKLAVQAAPIAAWVQKDMADCLAFLRQRGKSAAADLSIWNSWRLHCRE